MKSILIFTNLLFIGIIIWLLLHCTQTKVEGTASLCSNFESFTPSELSVGLIKEMVTNYRTNQLASIKGSATNPMAEDAQSIWFDIDTLKKFIYHIERGVQNNNAPVGTKLGVRIYYAAYPLKNKWNAPGYEALSGFMGNTTTEQYEKMHTLVMLPTIKYGNVYADFNPSDKTSYNGGFNGPIKDRKNKLPSSAKVMALAGTTDPSNDGTQARNHGELIPPGDPSGNAF